MSRRVLGFVRFIETSTQTSPSGYRAPAMGQAGTDLGPQGAGTSGQEVSSIHVGQVPPLSLTVMVA